MNTLLATSGHHIGRRFQMGRVTKLGRAADNEIILHGNLVSRYHAQIVCTDDVYKIEDLDSKNGIYVNEKRVQEAELSPGDRVSIGENSLVFNAPQELLTARFTNTLVHIDPDQDETMESFERTPVPRADQGGETGLILKLAQIFEASSSDLPELLENALKQLLDLFGATAGSILLRSRDDAVVPLTALAKGNELHLSRAASRCALMEGEAVLTSSLLAMKGDGGTKRQARRAMIVPMFDGDEPFGAIHLERPEGPDYAVKDLDFLQALSRLVSGAVRQALRIDRMAGGMPSDGQEILGDSEGIRKVRVQIGRVAPTDSSVLITGETGTGKELVARAIHEQSTRAKGPFLAINCAAIPGQLLESEFFGYERGAFTGANSMHRGKFEMADGGTLFLDEIGEMALDLQPKILRFLEERIFYRVGGVRPIKIDVRVLAATNRKLSEAIEQGQFREDLFYRLNVVNIDIPPLRERREDIHVLINHFAPIIAARLGKPFSEVHNLAWSAVANYYWPGNVRELLQGLERALILSDDGILLPKDFQIPGTDELDFQTGTVATPTTAAPRRRTDAPMSLPEVEKLAITEALQYARGSKTKAAEILQIHRNTLRNKIKEYGIPDSGTDQTAE